MPRPLILLAFANERVSGDRYLRQLPVEINALRRTLDRAREAGLCEYDILTNTTLDLLVETLRKPRVRESIAIFHYSGHADSLELLLESETGSAAAAHASGLVPLLADLPGLQLVFINGCYSAQQAEALCNQGVPAVIGTVKAVDDHLAAQLSRFFYEGLADGLPLEQAWHWSVHRLRAERGENAADYYDQRERGIGRPASPGRFPWELRYRDAAGEAGRWSLPVASDNPLFGLPALPDHYELPNEPYRYLHRYDRSDAAIFFGRGLAVQQLYRRLTAADGSPIVTLYGQSGVGKSSLLEAGLFPRLEEAFELIYLRRDAAQGLPRQVQEALSPAAVPDDEAVRAAERRQLETDIDQYETALAQLTGDARKQVEALIGQNRERIDRLQQPAPTIRDAWRQREALGTRPLILVLDQVEEIFTQPHADRPDELEGLMRQLQQLFLQPADRPTGKLLLSYRKEYHPEVTRALSEFKLLHEDFFLTRLDRKGIREIVLGLTQTEALRRKYRLHVDPELTDEVASHLLADQDSPVAPVLQIILAKLWEKQAGREERSFRLADYLLLREEGILLEDFFRQQMQEISKWEQVCRQPVESSGLALDILNFHTTRLGTAKSRDPRQIALLYEHQAEVLQALLTRFQEVYLLTRTGEGTALAHDTLAPIVQREIHDSDRPGQRALRILEAKVLDYARDKEETILEEDDLATVENGRPGMRDWLPLEVELIEKSRRHRAELQAERRRNRRFRRGAVAAIGVLLVVAVFLWRQSETRRRQVERDAAFTEARLLAGLDPTAALAHMAEIYPADEFPAQRRAERDDVYRTTVQYDWRFRPRIGQLNRAAFSADGRRFVLTTDSDNRIRLYDTGQPEPADSFTLAGSPSFALAFGEDGSVFIGSLDRRAYRWDPATGAVRTYAPAAGYDSSSVHGVAPGRGGGYFFTLHSSGRVGVWEENSARRISTLSEANVTALTAAPRPQTEEEIAWLGTATGEVGGYAGEVPVARLTAGEGSSIGALCTSADGHTLAAGDESGRVTLWRWHSDAEIGWRQVRQLAIGQTPVVALALEDSTLLLVALEDGTTQLWDVAGGRLLYKLLGHRGAVHSLAVCADGRFAFTAGGDTTLRRWPLPNPHPFRIQAGNGYAWNDLVWPSDGGLAGVRLDSQIVRLDSLGQTVRPVQQLPRQLSGGSRLSPDGRFAAGLTKTDTLQLIDLEQNHSIFSAAAPAGASKATLALSSRWLAVQGGDQIQLRDRQQPGAAATSAAASTAIALAITADERYLISAAANGRLTYYVLPQLKPAHTQELGRPLRALYPLPGETAVLALTEEPDVALLVLTPRSKALPVSGDGIAAGLATGELYAVSGAGCSVVIYRSDGRWLERLQGPADCRLSALAFSPDGQYLVGGTSRGELLWWRLARRPH